MTYLQFLHRSLLKLHYVFLSQRTFHQDLLPCSSVVDVMLALLVSFFLRITSEALIASHQRINVGVGMTAIGLSLVTFFGMKKNIVRAGLLRSSSTLLHLFQECHHSYSCVLLSSPGGLLGGSHRIPLLLLPYTISTPFSHYDKASSNFFNSSFSKACPSNSARFRHIANALPILSSLLHIGPTA